MRLALSIVVIVALASCSKSATPAATDVGTADQGHDMAMTVDMRSVDQGLDAAPDLAPDIAATPDLGPPRTDVPFNEAVFVATHNSYSGGSRGKIVEQLDGGARFIEFDLQADDVATVGYQVGHDMPGDEVELGAPNPDDDVLANWFAVVQQWRAQHPDHLPLTIGIDVKDALIVRTYADGNLAYLNDFIADTFGDALFTEAEAAGGWPTVEELRGRVLVMLSGDTATRLTYRETAGTDPAIARSGDTVAVAHTRGAASMLWTGSPTDLIRYEPMTGTDPAIAIDADGTLVWVSVVNDTLQVRTGVIGGDRSVAWDGPATAFPDTTPAIRPSVRFADPTTLVEIHETPAGALQYWDGTWDATSRTIVWAQAISAAPRHDEASDDGLTVTSEVVAPYTEPMVLINDGTATRRMRLQQRMWSESQFSGPAEFEDDGVFFYAADAFGVQDVAWAEEKRAAGGIVRLWKFDLPNVQPNPPVTYPATDQPSATWYVDYCRSVRCIIE